MFSVKFLCAVYAAIILVMIHHEQLPMVDDMVCAHIRDHFNSD